MIPPQHRRHRARSEMRASPASKPGRRLRVLQMVGFLATDGGAERFALGLATHLPQDRFEPWVCAPRGAEPDAVAALDEAGVPLVDLGRRGRWDAHRTAALVPLLRRG